jgi:peptidoglycan/LPS O-acetylase OafA/YrhL
MPSQDDARLEWLDLFRGLAAVAVVAFHYWWALKLPEFGFGFLAVDLFFVLSGIVLGLRYAPRIKAGMTFKDFAWQRVRRLYPMLLIATGLILLANAAGMPASHLATVSLDTILALPTLLPYSPNFGAGALFPANSPVWSLWAELLVNTLWFFALRFGPRTTKTIFLASACIYILAVTTTGSLDMGAHSSVLNITIGLFRAMTWFGVGYAISMKERTPPMSPSASLALVAAGCFAFQHDWYPVPAGLLVIVCGTSLLMALMHAPPPNRRVSKVYAWIGLVSYPLYLTHIPTGRLAVWAIEHGVRVSVAHVGSFLLVACVATLVNEWVVNRLPRSLSSLTWRVALPVKDSSG